MNKLFSKGTTTTLIFSILFSLFGPIFPAIAAEFNPNFLISDEEIQTWDSMSRADIDLFLDEKGSYLRTYKTEDKDGTKRKASDIIYRAAREHKINPKYILVKLQKEQSLITETEPTKKQLDWATGYGVCDACAMDDPSIQKHRGFGNQVDSAAGIMRWYYENVDDQDWIKHAGKHYTIDGQTIIPATNATAFLYTYTPHIQGNQNFWKLWQKWFDQVYPDGSLLKSKEEATIYLLEEGKKRPIKNMSALVTRFDPKRILIVPQSEITRYPDGAAISFPNYSLLRDGNKIYLLDYDTIRPFDSEETVRKIGYNPDEIIDVESSDIAAMDIGNTITLKEGNNPFGEILNITETNSFIFIKDGITHTIIDPQIAKVAYPNIKTRKASIKETEKYAAGEPLKFPDGTLLKTPTSNKIYVIEHGKKRHIPNEEVFLGLGYKWENIIITNELVSSIHPIGSALSLRKEIPNTVQNPNTPEKPSTSSPTKAKTFENVKLGSNGLPIFVDTGLMYAVSEEKTVFVGKKFDTDVNTYLIADAKTGAVLAGKNIDVVRPLASFTKVMTGFTAFKKKITLNSTVTYNDKEHKGMFGSFRLKNGEKVRNSDLMSTMLVSSNNSAARMVADSVEKDEQKFVKEMNASVSAWGLRHTKFVEPSGADLGNISTAKEYAKIFQEATKNATLLDYLGEKEYRYDEVKDIDGQATHFDSNSNLLMKRNDLPFTILASKTGYLIESGAGLAMMIERKSDKKRFIVITMGNPDYENRFVEPEKLSSWAIKTF